ncbi:hypothetical protein STAS_22554 [Striga asiatica]|uniref:Uncharacterized protein n=1 Tax=Striga asiatica TaxID=4170 RepID=A0A5A7QJT7_STRAF|nr:hypothetical protein STAS_22554 [Striga asiatica]
MDFFLPSANCFDERLESLSPITDHNYRINVIDLGWILSTLEPAIIAQVVDCTTTADLWNDFRSTYSQRASASRVLDLRLQLQTLKKGSSSCQEFMKKMKSIADQLPSIGVPVSEQDLVLHVLTGLGAEYESFVTAITTRSDLVTWPDLQGLLLTQERRLQGPSGTQTDSETDTIYRT